MAGFKKETEKICGFREDTINLEENIEEVILEIKVCVKDKNKTVKLDWAVDEELTASDFGDATTFTINPNATVEYNFCRNDEQIGSTITSKNQISSRISNISGISLESSFIVQTQPNFTFCDETPDLGINCYQVKAKLLPPNMGFNPINSASVSDRSLNAIY